MLSKFTKTIRGKLSGFYFISHSLLFFILGLSFFFLVKVILRQQIDHHLHIVVNQAKEIIEQAHWSDKNEILRNLVSANGMTIVLLSPEGNPLIQTNSHDVASVSEHQMKQIIAASNYISEPSHFDVDYFRFATTPVSIPEYQEGIVAVGFSTQVWSSTLNQLVYVSIVVLTMILIFFSWLWNKFLKNQLSPLEKIAHSIEGIQTSQDLNLQISPLPKTRELSTIAKSFNKLIDKMRAVFFHEHEFFSDTAHTLKTPLAILQSRVEKLPQKNSQRRSMLVLIKNINLTIQDLLLISRLKTTPLVAKKKISLTKVVKKVAELTKVLGEEKNIKVRVLVEDKINVLADENLINRALANIAKNAVEHEKRSGTISFTLKKDASKKITLIIADTGEGITKKEIKKIFTRFYGSTKPSRGKKKTGTGLGLAISKEIVESHQAKIKVSSKLGYWTKVKIIFS